ncbi:MAG: hypothetical protein Q7R95_03125 [bacterium]|nr:hypothetical protein [bacterium]
MENLKYTSTNWMLDEAKKTCTQCLANTDAVGVGFDYTEHAIQKIEYGRTCINQILAQGGQTAQSIIDNIKKLDVQLQEKITEMGATPKGIVHLEKN